MDASDLSEWIAIFQMELTPDGAGGFREAIPAGLIEDIPAKVEQTSLGQVAGRDQVADRVSHKITIRWNPDVSTLYRVSWRDILLDIVSVKNVGSADIWTELTCERKEMGEQ